MQLNITKIKVLTIILNGESFEADFKTAIGDDTSIAGGRTATKEEYLTKNSYAVGDKSSFTDFDVQYLDVSWPNGTGAGSKFCLKLRFLFNKNLKDKDGNYDDDKIFHIYLRGQKRSVHFATVAYKVQKWFEYNHYNSKLLKKHKIEYDTEDEEDWVAALRNMINGYGLTIDKVIGINDKNNFEGKAPYKEQGITEKRLKRREKDITFKTTANEGGKKIKGYGKKAQEVTTKTGVKYDITITDMYYLVLEDTLYYTLYINDMSTEKDDAQLQQGMEETENMFRGIELKQIRMASATIEDRKETGNFHDVIDDINYYKPGDEKVSDVVTDKVSIVLTNITNIGMVFAILMLAILGIKYMLGSVEEKAEYKKDLIPYFIGAGLLFGICAIIGVLQKFGETINGI